MLSDSFNAASRCCIPGSSSSSSSPKISAAARLLSQISSYYFSHILLFRVKQTIHVISQFFYHTLHFGNIRGALTVVLMYRTASVEVAVLSHSMVTDFRRHVALLRPNRTRPHPTHTRRWKEINERICIYPSFLPCFCLPILLVIIMIAMIAMIYGGDLHVFSAGKEKYGLGSFELYTHLDPLVGSRSKKITCEKSMDFGSGTLPAH